MPELTTPQHGGGLISAAKKYKIPLENWIDLSTGINPHGWPVPNIPPEVFNRLPEDNDGLLDAAKSYYAVDQLLAIAGSQAAIQLLPQLRACCRVAVPETAYAEHAYAWQQAGHCVEKINPGDIPRQLQHIDVLVLINPNNPSGEKFTATQLLHWHQQLQGRGGWLIVDEAFMDSNPENSLLPYHNRPGLIVLRSIGKFFGLAGIRCGFIMGDKNILQKLKTKLGPWTLSGPTRFIGSLALADTAWQMQTRAQLKSRCQRLNKLLHQYFTQAFATDTRDRQFTIRGTELFQTVFLHNATHWHNKLAEQGVLTRLLDNQQGIRFGLPKDSQWEKLESIFTQVFATQKQHEPV